MSGNQQPIQLDQFLKFCGITGTGGEAKLLIQGGEVLVNGERETRRRRKLAPGDVVKVHGQSYPLDALAPDRPKPDNRG